MGGLDMRAIEASWLRDTEKCTQLADILTKLSDVELFCAQNWGRETIAYVISNIRPGASRGAISVDRQNEIYDVWPQKCLPVFPSAALHPVNADPVTYINGFPAWNPSVIRLNTGAIEFNSEKKTFGAFPASLFPRLRICCSLAGLAVEPECRVSDIEIQIGLYFYNRLEEIGFERCGEGNTCVKETWPLEIYPQLLLPGEKILLRKTDGSIFHCALAWSPDGWNRIVTLIKTFTKEGQPILLFERPSGNMFFNQERLAQSPDLPVVITEDPDLYLNNYLRQDGIVLGCFGDVREISEESLAILKGRKLYWAMSSFSCADYQNVINFLDVINKIGKRAQILNCSGNISLASSSDDINNQIIPLDDLIKQAQIGSIPIPDSLSLRNCGFVDPAAMSTRSEHAAVICDLIQRGEVTVIEESPAVPAWIVSKTLLKIRRQKCKRFLGHAIPACLPKLVVFCAQEDAMNFAQLLDADDTTTVCSLPCNWNGDELQAHVRRAVERVRASLILLAVPSSKIGKNILAPLMWYCRQKNLSLLVESRLGHEEKKVGTEFGPSADRCCRLLSARKNNRLKVMLEEQDETGEVRCSMVTLVKGFLGGSKPATPEERALFHGHSRTVDQGDDLSFKLNRFMQEEL